MQLDLAHRPTGLPIQASSEKSTKGSEYVQSLQRKGFHTEEVALAKQLCRRITTEEVPALDAQDGFFRPAEQLHEGLLGAEGSHRLALLEGFPELREEADAREKLAAPQLALQGKSMSGLHSLVAEIEFRASLIASSAPQVLNYQVSSRSPAMLFEAGAVAKGDKPSISNNALLKWIQIFQRQRIMALICLGPESGSLEMRPFVEDAGAHKLALRPGSMVLLRADCLTHRFSSKGKCYVLGCFLLAPNPLRNAPLASYLKDDLANKLLKLKESSKSEDDFELKTSRELQRIANQNLHKGHQTAIRGCAGREPVAAHDADAFCNAVMAGIDGGQMIPHMRWDHEQYYSSDPLKDQDPFGKWKTHCNHGAFIEGLELFDNKMFKISNLEAGGMDPNQRQALEIFLETTLSAGIDEKKLMRSNVGVFLGGPGGAPEFSALPKDDQGGALGSTNNSPAIMANRISFCMGIHGPNFFIDLEGAGSLIAFNLAVDAIQPDKAQCIGAVALGLDCNVHPQGLLSLGWAGLLSRKGRCLSFDSYADGYIRGEGFTGLYVNPLKKEVDGKKIIDEDPPIIGLASGGFVNNNGRSAALTAPSGAMYQELVGNSLRSADISPLDVEAVECQAAGNVLSDAVEATALIRAYRSTVGEGGEDDEEMLGLLAAKTNIGNLRPAAGVAALLRVIVGQAMGCMPPSLHLHKLNPHIVAEDGVPAFIATEPAQHRMPSAFVGCTACGIGGSNAHAILWGRAVTRPVKMETAVRAEEVLSFWPGGGGELGPECEPRRGCSIAGSWGLPDQCERMRGEGLDQYSFKLTLGEHGREWFQIWLDGEKDRILHPHSFKGRGEEKVQGPHAFCQAAVFGWVIDTRPPPVEGNALVPATDEVSLPLDDGDPGDEFEVKLQVKGRFRSVTWERLDSKNVQRNGLPRTMGRYFIAGSWNDWKPEEMLLEDEAVGRFTAKATLPKGNQRFHILRNRDWRQLVYPETCYADCDDDVPVKGPDAAGYDSYWSIEVPPSRNVFFIDLELWPEGSVPRDGDRRARPAVSKMKVSWRSVGKQELSQQELFEKSRPSFYLVGSWDCWLRKAKMRFDGLRQCYAARAPRALRGGDLFQILSNGDWNSVLHPSGHEAGLENPSASRGGGTRGYPAWRMDKDETEEEMSQRRRASDRWEVLLNIRSTPWKVSWQKCSSDQLDDSSDEDLDPELYGPPGADGL